MSLDPFEAEVYKKNLLRLADIMMKQKVQKKAGLRFNRHEQIHVLNSNFTLKNF